MSSPLATKLNASGILSEEDLGVLKMISARQQSVPRQHPLTQEGKRPKQAYIVIDGWLARYHDLPGGSRQISAFLLPGDICDVGDAAFSRADHSVLALTPVRVASVTWEEVDNALRDRPNLRLALRWAALVEQAVSRMWLTNIGRRNAYARLAHRLCELHARLKLVGMVQGQSFELPITQEQLADALGLTSVHTNRTLQTLRSDGLLALSNHRVTIVSPSRLSEAAGFDPAYLHLQPE